MPVYEWLIFIFVPQLESFFDMKVLIAMMLYDYGRKERGYSYEYYNVYLPLKDQLGESQVLLFDYYSECQKSGIRKINQSLGEFIQSEKPDVSVFCLYKEEFEDRFLAEYRKHTKTIAYFIDDEWRQDFFRRYIPHFDHFSTRDYYLYRSYLAEGLNQAIYCPLGFNDKIYIKKDLPIKYDISFVGGSNPERRWIVDLLQKEGLKVNVFGRGWGLEDRWVTQEEMVDIFNQSRINLNLTNSKIYDVRFMLYALKYPRSLRSILRSQKTKEGIKGRHFEICGSGGFQLSFYVRGLNLFYQIDKEIVVYENIDSIADYIKFYLKNEELRVDIAKSGYDRSISEHSSQKYVLNMVMNANG